MPRGKYFDDLQIGERHVTTGRTITEAHFVLWSGVVGFVEESFINYEMARQGPFGRTIIPGHLTLSVAASLYAETGLLAGTSIALLSLNMRALAPVFIGDTIHVDFEVSNKKRSASRPDRGVVTVLNTVINQEDRAVMSYKTDMMLWRRPELVEAEEAR